jgi:hypothetical protein
VETVRCLDHLCDAEVEHACQHLTSVMSVQDDNPQAKSTALMGRKNPQL